MPHIKPVYRPADYPGDPAEIAAFFAMMQPGNADPAFDVGHSGLAVAAHNPELALKLGGLSRFLAVDTGWSQRTDLRELAIQTVNARLKSDFSTRSRLYAANAAGVSEAMLAALPDGSGDLFSDEQQLVIAYAGAVVTGTVDAALSGRIVARYGEKGAVEATAVIAFWAFWAMFLNATGPDF